MEFYFPQLATNRERADIFFNEVTKRFETYPADIHQPDE
jgi:hypothetical protein